MCCNYLKIFPLCGASFCSTAPVRPETYRSSAFRSDLWPYLAIDFHSNLIGDGAWQFPLDFPVRMFRRSRFSVRPNVGVAGRTAAAPPEAPPVNQKNEDASKITAPGDTDTAVAEKSAATPSENPSAQGWVGSNKCPTNATHLNKVLLLVGMAATKLRTPLQQPSSEGNVFLSNPKWSLAAPLSSLGQQSPL